MTAPVVIEVALNGATSPARNPHVPVTPEAIARDALACLDAGATVVHSHIDDWTATGTAAATRYLAAWEPILRARPDAILYPTVPVTGAVEERFAHVPLLAHAARMGVLDPGSVTLGAAGPDGLPGPLGVVYANSYADIRHAVDQLAAHGLGPSIAVFEPGFLRNALAYHRAGRLPPGAFVKLYFGGEHDVVLGARSDVTFGLPPTQTALGAYLELLDGTALPWAVAVLGGDVVALGLARLALERGGHVRVGLEDWAGPGTPTNRELVEVAAAAARAAGRPVATPAEAARILGLPR